SLEKISIEGRQNVVHDPADQAQWMLRRHPLLKVHIREQLSRPRIHAPHSCLHKSRRHRIIFAIDCQETFFSSLLDACKIFYQTTIFNDLEALNVVYVLGGRGFNPLIQSEPSTFGIDLSAGPACTP